MVEEIETKKALFLEEIETALFFSEALNNLIFECLEDLEEFNLLVFLDLIEWEFSKGTEKADFLQWELIKKLLFNRRIKKNRFSRG